MRGVIFQVLTWIYKSFVQPCDLRNCTLVVRFQLR
jgi:hypothetical protein